MEIAWIGSIVIVLLGAGVLSARLWCYRKQLEHMLEELLAIGKEDTNALLTSAFPVGKTENVIGAINCILERERKEKEQLRRENRSYRESITSISHDIRTPLTSAKGYIQMLGDACVGQEKQEAYREIVEKRLTELTGMLDQLFLYARLEAGEAKLERERINAGNLFAETLSLFYEDFAKTGFEPRVEISREAVCIQADRSAFVRLLENLLKNALVHGTGDYQFSLTKGEGKAVISIANRTDSIKAWDMEYIFDRFYTTDTSRSRRTTGLGLAIVKELTEQMEGEIKAFLEQGLFRVEVSFPCLQNDENHVY